jgi:tetratricopeptide (TPR) repeat protein
MAAAKHGLYLDRTGGATAAAVKFTEAVEFFHSARTGEYMSSYPFYSEAWMLFARAKTLSGNDRLRLIGKAFEVLDQSEGNVDEEGKASLAEMEGKIIAYLSEIPDLDRAIEALIAAGDPEGEYLKARRASGLYKEGFDRKSAYFIVMEGLDKAPDNLPCLRLASRLHIQVLPGDWEDWLKLLKRRFDLEGGKGQAGLLFDLGHACSQLGRYKDAHRYFEELEVESEGHPRRSGIIKVVSDGDKPRLLTGVVKQSLSRWEGWLRCDVIGQELKFFPLKQKFTVMKGQTVQFQLALNYRGFLASELRPA